MKVSLFGTTAPMLVAVSKGFAGSFELTPAANNNFYNGIVGRNDANRRALTYIMNGDRDDAVFNGRGGQGVASVQAAVTLTKVEAFKSHSSIHFAL